ncbi:Cell division protein SepF [Candidatus Gugararchaeum adminiculabundum]|nr:Cell division protein SepF [Candidatus Gugararchaeum adminiculabundum]
MNEGVYTKILNKVTSALTGKDASDEPFDLEKLEQESKKEEPPDHMVKSVHVVSEKDVETIEEELKKRNILILDISGLEKRPATLKRVLDKVREFVVSNDGDLARLDETRLLVAPRKVRIIKKQYKKKKQQ